MKRRLICAAIAAVTAAQAAAGAADTLVFTRTDGSLLPMRGKTYVWCGKWDDGRNVRALRIQQGSWPATRWWMFEVRVALAHRGQSIALPVLVGPTATMFVGDRRSHIEASAESERSRGMATFLADAGCRPGTQVRLSLRATLASEQTGGPSVRVSGTFTGTVGTTPAPHP